MKNTVSVVLTSCFVLLSHSIFAEETGTAPLGPEFTVITLQDGSLEATRVVKTSVLAVGESSPIDLIDTANVEVPFTRHSIRYGDRLLFEKVTTGYYVWGFVVTEEITKEVKIINDSKVVSSDTRTEKASRVVKTTKAYQYFDYKTKEWNYPVECQNLRAEYVNKIEKKKKSGLLKSVQQFVFGE